MKRTVEVSSFSSPIGLVDEVRQVLEKDETISSVITAFLQRLVSRRKK